KSGLSSHESVAYARARSGGAQSIAVRLEIIEFERIGRDEILGVFFKASVIRQRTNPLGRSHSEVEGTFRANVEIVLKNLRLENLAAAIALDPKSFGNFGSSS